MLKGEQSVITYLSRDDWHKISTPLSSILIKISNISLKVCSKIKRFPANLTSTEFPDSQYPYKIRIPTGNTNLGLSQTHIHTLRPLEAAKKKGMSVLARASGPQIAPSSRDVLYDGDNIAKIDFS